MGAWPVAIAAGGCAAGVLAGRTFPGLASVFVLCAVAGGLAAVFAICRPARRVAVGGALVALALSSGANSAWRTAGHEARILPKLAAAERSVKACGTALRERPRSVEVEIRTVATRDERWQVREPLLLVGEAAVRMGQRVCVEGVVRFPRQSQLESDPPVFLAPRNVTLEGIGSPIRRAAGTVRDRFREKATAALGERQAGLLLGMTTGDRTLLDEETVESFRTTGLAHLVAVSGFHVAVVLGLLGFGVQMLVSRGRWLRAALVAPPVIFFAFLVGLTPSVLRATVTAGIVLAVVASGRTAESLRVACVAFVALLFASPDLLFRPGFQMSFGATFGLILWARRIAESLADLWPFETGRRPVEAASLLLGTALAAQLGVAPLLAAHFGQVPAAGGLANLVAVPLAPAVVGGGLVTLTLASAWDELAWAPVLVTLPIDVILATARGFSRLPGASIDAGLAAAAAMTAAAAALLTGSRSMRAASAALALVLVSVTGGRLAAERRLDCPGAEIRAIDVGGTAVLLRAEGALVLGDGGPKEGDVVRELRALGVRRLDLLIASHPHADHIEGLAEIVRTMDVGAVLAPATIGWGAGGELVEAAAEAGVPLVEATAPRTFDIGELGLEVLAPGDGPLPDPDPSLINRYNLVVRATVGGVTVLLPGDADGLLQMLLAPHDVGADMLVAPHHGSADLHSGFVETVSPAITLVTVGRGNPYGHPSPVAMKIYETHGAVFSTDRHGDVVVCVGGEELEVTTAR